MNSCRVLAVHASNRIVWPSWLNRDYMRTSCLELLKRPLLFPHGAELGDVATLKECPSEGHDDPVLFVEGNTMSWHGLGKGWREGTLKVCGHAGDEVGSLMLGGSIDIEGSVQSGAGSGMSGGTLTVRGSAGDFLGGPWGNRPWQGGTIVAREAGNHAGFAMARGILIVDRAGDSLGSLMRAGTIVVKEFQAVGRGIRRGSIVTFDPMRPPDYFQLSGVLVSSYMDLLRVALRQNERDWLDRIKVTQRFMGDQDDLAKGEFLLCQ